MGSKRTATAVEHQSNGRRGGGRAGLQGLPSVEDEFADNPVVQELRRLDDQYLILKEQCKVEQNALDRKYEQRCGPILERRRQRLGQLGEPTAPGTASGAAASGSSSSQGHRKATPAVPGFWKTVLQNSDEFQEDIEEHDESPLDYLRDIRHEYMDEAFTSGFRLIFSFENNPFFTDTELVKVYHTARKNEFVDIMDCVRVEAPQIHWRPGKNVTVQLISSKKAKGAGRHKQKARWEEVSRTSFFRTFFRNLGPDEELPEEELDDLYDGEEEDAMDLMDCLLHDDYEQAIALRDWIVPHAVRWFTGDACDDDDDDDDEEEEEEEEEDIDVDVEEDSAAEAEAESDQAARAGRPFRGLAAGAVAASFSTGGCSSGGGGGGSSGSGGGGGSSGSGGGGGEGSSGGGGGGGGRRLSFTFDARRRGKGPASNGGGGPEGGGQQPQQPQPSPPERASECQGQ